MEADSDKSLSKGANLKVDNGTSFSQNNARWSISTWKTLQSWKDFGLWKIFVSLKSILPWMSDTQQLNDEEGNEEGYSDHLSEAMPTRWMVGDLLVTICQGTSNDNLAGQTCYY